MEWVEVRGRTIEEAVALGLRELGLDSADAAEIEVLQQPQRGFLGIGGQDALVRIKPRPKRRQRHRRSRAGTGEGTPVGNAPRGESHSGGGGRGQGRPQGRGSGRQETRRPRPESGGRREGPGRGPRPEAPSEERRPGAPRPPAEEPGRADLEEQAGIVREFLVGLVEAFGLEGEVTTRLEGDIIYADVTGDQTEALIGPKGVILDAVLELCRTMVHRQSQAGARLRLDIGGYNERRREALRIYAGRLAEKVLDGGGEIMLEPMNPADRKVVHDTVAEIDGVRSYSEGEDPERSVVIAPEESD
jgi:spoIIIJ-associated protein